MSMSKKDYEAIAKMVKERIDLPLGSRDIKLFIKDLSNYFEEDNEKFNKDRFLKACGVV